MDVEFKALMSTNTWSLVPPSPHINPLGVKWVFKTKRHANGSIRLVGKGYTQVYGLDYNETFSPVAKPSTIRLLLSIAASQWWSLRQLDVQNAFLHGTLQEDVFIIQPPGIRPTVSNERSWPLSYILGIEVSRSNDEFYLSQSKYIKELIDKAGMTNCKSVSTPMSTDFVAIQKKSSPPFSNPTLYRSMAGGLQYLAFTRPDIPFVVNRICQAMHGPDERHWTTIKRIIRYLKATSHLKFFISAASDHQLSTYSDADWGGSSKDSRSTGAYCVYHVSNLVSWTSKKQSTVSRSSTEPNIRPLLQPLVRHFGYNRFLQTWGFLYRSTHTLVRQYWRHIPCR